MQQFSALVYHDGKILDLRIHSLMLKRLRLNPYFSQYLDRPRVSPVVLFVLLIGTLGLLRALIYPPDGSEEVPLFALWPTLERLGVAASWVMTALWLIRPGQRRWWEWGVAGVLIAGLCILAIWWAALYIAVLAVTVLVRFWLPFRFTLVTLLIMLPLGWAIFALTGPNTDYGYGQSPIQFIQVLLITFAQVAFAYAAFEFMLRNEEKKRDLEAALAQLQEYRGLELRHAALQERAHLSRELHDTLGHHLTVLRLEAQRARKLTQRSTLDLPEVTQAMTQVVQRSGDSLSQLQEIVSTLKTPQLNGTLYQALDDLVQHWPGQVELIIEGEEPELPSQHRLSVYRSLQEALTNAYKYAQGQPVQARVRQIGQCLELRVRNPCLCPSAEAALPTISGGHGLSGLRARLEALGGQLNIYQSEEVFELCLSLPIPR
jgi:signal transduction histidine kinase